MKPIPQKSTVHTHWQIVFPNLVNTHGAMFGGKILEIMDMMAGVAGSMYCRTAITTVSIEAVDFIAPVKSGNRLETQAKVVFTGRSSLMVKVACFVHDHLTGESRPCARGYFNMVSLGTNGKPMEVPELLTETEEERKDFDEARLYQTSAKERRKK